MAAKSLAAFGLILIGLVGCDSGSKGTAQKSSGDGFEPPPTHVIQMDQINRLGLPELSVPQDNPITGEKVALGNRLYHDTRFSSTGEVSCATCHADAKALTDRPLKVAQGVNDQKGTRNSPTVLNAAFNQTQFWDGRSPSLEDQALHPPVNPVEMGLENHEPILETIRGDQDYVKSFQSVFGVGPQAITMDHVTQAIATFERTQIAGNSRFDQWYFQGKEVLSPAEKRGFDLFINKGRCVPCHAVEHDSALFTDHKFHNIGVGIKNLSDQELENLSQEFLQAEYGTAEVDVKVLKDPKSSELGRFAVNRDLSMIGAFKTPTLRNIALTAPYMHDGSQATLEEVVRWYNRGGAPEGESPDPLVSGGIKPLNLTDQEVDDLVAFLRTLTSEQFATNQP